MLRSEVGGSLSLPSPAVITLDENLDLTVILHPHLCSGVKAVLRVLNKMHVKCPAWCLAQDKHQRSMSCYFQYFGDIISLYLSHNVVSDHSLTFVSLSPDTIR